MGQTLFKRHNANNLKIDKITYEKAVVKRDSLELAHSALLTQSQKAPFHGIFRKTRFFTRCLNDPYFRN